MPSSAPTGRVALVFTDVQDSTVLWERAPDAMREGLALHDALMRELLATWRGYEVKTEGDAFMIAFGDGMSALGFCAEVQQALCELSWPPELLAMPEARERDGIVGLRVRMGVHLGHPHCRPNPLTHRMDYFGTVVNRAARVASAAHGGQILATGETWAARGDSTSLAALDLGAHSLKGLTGAVQLYNVAHTDAVPRTFPPPRTKAAALPLGEGRGGQQSAEPLDDQLRTIAEALTARAEVRQRRSRIDEARTDFETAIACARSVGDLQLAGRALNRLGRLFWEQGRVEDAQGRFLQALDVARTADDPWIEATARAYLANVAIHTDRLDDAHDGYQAALALHRRLGNRRSEAMDLGNLGIVHRRRGQLDLAEKCYREALALHEEVDNTHGAMMIRMNLALLAARNRSPEAITLLEEVVAEARANRAERIESKALGNLAGCYIDAGELESAETTLRACLALDARRGDAHDTANNRYHLGLVHHLRGALDDAERHYAEALVMAERSGRTQIRAWCLCLRAILAAEREVMDTATTHLDAARALVTELDDNEGRNLVAIAADVIDVVNGNPHGARRRLDISADGTFDVRVALLLLRRVLDAER